MTTNMARLLRYSWPRVILLVLSTMLIISNISSKAESDLKESKMSKLAVRDMHLNHTKNGPVVAYALCNTSPDETLYIEKRLIPGNYDTIWGVEVEQEGKLRPFLGPMMKLKAAVFPTDYVALKPDQCLPVSIHLSSFFDLLPEKKILLRLDLTYVRDADPHTDIDITVETKLPAPIPSTEAH